MNSRSTTSVLAFVLFLSTGAGALAAFPDVPSSHTDVEAIAYLEEHEIFKGKPMPDGTMRFDPLALLNRAELVTILVRVLGVDISVGTVPCFGDVQPTSWYFEAVCTAERMGIISGYPDKTFKPGQAVNKVEAMKIIMNAFGFSGDVNMYANRSVKESQEWYSPYVVLATEWNLFDQVRTAKSLDASMTRSDIAQLLYRTVITGMHRTVSGEIPVFSEELAQEYANRDIELWGMTDADAFEELYANGVQYRNKRLGFSFMLPKTMPTYMCDFTKPATIVDVKAIERDENVFIGPAWYESEAYLGENPDGSGRYGECTRHEMLEEGNDAYTRVIRTAVAENDARIKTFIGDVFGEACGDFERRPSLQNGVEDVIVESHSLAEASESEEELCVTNYVYVLKYNPATKRILAVNLGQDGFIYLPKKDGTFGQALDLIMMKTLRMF